LPKTKANGLLQYYKGYYDGTRLMEFDSICSWSAKERATRKNEIFAKYGRPVPKGEIRNAFQATDWYIANPAYSGSMLTRTDLENLKRIEAFENRNTEDDGLFDYLLSGGTVTCEREELDVIRVNSDSIRFKFDYEKYYYDEDETPFTLSPRKIKEDGYDSGQEVWFFRYDGFYYFIQKFCAPAMHGCSTDYIRIQFQYDPGRHILSDISIER
jgi:hypothetical protein